jgi:hypothetical protein
VVQLVQPAQWEYLAQPAPRELLGLTVLQEPPASLEFLVLLVQPGSTGQQVLLELQAVMVPQAQQVSSVFQALQVLRVLRAQQGQPVLTGQAVLLEPQA